MASHLTNYEPIPEAGCYIWMGAALPSGYGTIRRKGKTLYTHRVAWEDAYGLIPKGLSVLHHCDTPACINPHHLFLGNHKDNAQDMVRKKRNRPWQLGKSKYGVLSKVGRKQNPVYRHLKYINRGD